ncbi:HAD family hydrolase [Corynebacterium liangguodongii]|uniref:HAD family hydrolase n=1 Tax=Corynebacterium liangguodongii TaxID=2079535 RepID=A0A2S0WBK1_9CORY|nr:HAD family hydrolase [Corynebacterium liangguodongii]AWB83130.1 HAD family hydrolase [Corynebacterium liangguodongii]PWB99269.1 HAD family hydrolase [Corynebacterium liangguodongii]
MDAVLFGLSGVILAPRSEAGRRAVERAAGAGDTARFWRAYAELRPDLEVGEVSDARWWQQVGLRAGLADIDVYEAIAADAASLASERRDMVDLLLELVDSGYAVGVIDNVPLGVATHVRECHPWLAELDAVTFSCDIGVGKPDAAAYLVALDAMGAKPGSTLYVDACDEWLAAAAALGVRTVRFTETTDLREDLTKP